MSLFICSVEHLLRASCGGPAHTLLVLQRSVPCGGVRVMMKIIIHLFLGAPSWGLKALSYLHESGGGTRDLGIRGNFIYINSFVCFYSNCFLKII